MWSGLGYIGMGDLLRSCTPRRRRTLKLGALWHGHSWMGDLLGERYIYQGDHQFQSSFNAQKYQNKIGIGLSIKITSHKVQFIKSCPWRSKLNNRERIWEENKGKDHQERII